MQGNEIMWEDGAEVCFSLLSSFHQVEVGFPGTPGMQLRWWKERLARGSLFAEKRVRACRGNVLTSSRVAACS